MGKENDLHGILLVWVSVPHAIAASDFLIGMMRIVVISKWVTVRLLCPCRHDICSTKYCKIIVSMVSRYLIDKPYCLKNKQLVFDEFSPRGNGFGEMEIRLQIEK